MKARKGNSVQSGMQRPESYPYRAVPIAWINQIKETNYEWSWTNKSAEKGGRNKEEWEGRKEGKKESIVSETTANLSANKITNHSILEPSTACMDKNPANR
jgi:hypothetical protein